MSEPIRYKVLCADNRNVSKCGVKVGDIGELVSIEPDGDVLLYSPNWIGESYFRSYPVYFNPEDVERLVDTNRAEIRKSRWDEIIDNLTSNSEMSKAEVDLVKSVLKNNTPYEVIPDPIDHIIEKEVQTHLDANFVGKVGNPHFYYKSEILNTWFCWDDDCDCWQECNFQDVTNDKFIAVKFG